MKGVNDVLSNKPEKDSHKSTFQQKDCSLEILPMTDISFSFAEESDVQIERFCRMISLGIGSPFPRSQQQLAYAVLAIKKSLKTISLVQLLERKPDVPQLAFENIRHELKPIKELEELLRQPLFKQSLPNLYQATRFMHKKDQYDILKILKAKVTAPPTKVGSL